MNQSSQKGFVAERLVRQTHGLAGSEGVSSLYRRDGTETLAELLFRIVRDRVLRPWVSFASSRHSFR
jgi:hypothetical protein